MTPEIARRYAASESNKLRRALLFVHNRELALYAADALTESDFECLLVRSEKTCLERLRYDYWDICVVDDAVFAEGLQRRLGEERIDVRVFVALEATSRQTLATDLRVAALDAAHRQGRASRGVCVEVGDLTIDPARFEAYVHSAPLGLTPREFQVLYLLSLEAGEPLTAAQIAFKLGLAETKVRKTITTRIAHVRRKLLIRRSTVQILNSRARGWRLVS